MPYSFMISASRADFTTSVWTLPNPMPLLRSTQSRFVVSENGDCFIYEKLNVFSPVRDRQIEDGKRSRPFESWQSIFNDPTKLWICFDRNYSKAFPEIEFRIFSFMCPDVVD